MTTAADREALREILKFLSRVETAWTSGRIDELRACFLEEAVLVGPDLEQRLEGRDPIVSSYAEFLQEARLLSFELEAPMVDVFGDSAVTVTAWRVEYEREGVVYNEEGQDLLVLARRDGEWKVAWRTLVLPGGAPGGEG
jgi:ketosteroid isomerase-like protein